MAEAVDLAQRPIPCLLVFDRFVTQREEACPAAGFGADRNASRRRVRRWP